MIKMIASDLDGTLLNRRHKISAENLAAIRKAQAKGVKFVIATGRLYRDVRELMDEFSLRCQTVLMNGAEYRDESGNIIDKVNVKKESVKEAVRILDSLNIGYQMFTDRGEYTTNSREKAVDGIVQRIRVFDPQLSQEEALKRVPSHPHFIHLNYVDCLEDFLNDGAEIRKIVAFHQDVELIGKAKREMEEIGGIVVLSSFVQNLEVTDEKAQKGYILKKVIEKQGIKEDEVLVMGDSFNDYSMFEVFKESVATKNAQPRIKEMAKYITDDCEDDGVAKAIYRILGLN
jgi:Cof subfamily protein (haloacid dehalogenase superfamily)